MKSKIKPYRKKTVLIVSLCLIGGFGQAANYDISSQDLLVPSKEEDQFQFGLPFDEREGGGFESLIDQEQESQQDSYRAVLELIKQNQFDQAETKVNQLIKQHPEQAEFYNLHAFVKIQQKKPALAEISFQKVLKLNPDNLGALQGLAFLAIEKNDMESAQNYLDKAIAGNPKAIFSYILKARIAYRQNDLSEVEKVLLAALKQARDNINFELLVADNLANLYALQQESLKMLELAQSLNQRQPNDNRALSLLAKAQLLNKQTVEGEQTLREIIAKDKQDIYHRLELVQLLSQKPGSLKEAAALIDEALFADPDNLKALMFKTVLLTKEKNYEPAMALAELIDQKHPHSAAGKLLKADVYLAQHQPEQALAYNLLAYQIQPNPKLLNNIVGLLAEQGKSEDAIQLLNNEIDKNPKDMAIHYRIANLYLSQKDYKKAESHYQVILKENPENAIILNNLAMVYYHWNDPRALGLAKRAYQSKPESPAIIDTYGIVLLQHGRHREALETLQKAAELAPGSNEIQLHLAKAYQANGNEQIAIEILEKIVGSSNDTDKKEAAVDLLKQLKKN